MSPFYSKIRESWKDSRVTGCREKRDCICSSDIPKYLEKRNDFRIAGCIEKRIVRLSYFKIHES